MKNTAQHVSKKLLEKQSKSETLSNQPSSLREKGLGSHAEAGSLVRARWGLSRTGDSKHHPPTPELIYRKRGLLSGGPRACFLGLELGLFQPWGQILLPLGSCSFVRTMRRVTSTSEHQSPTQRTEDTAHPA